MKRTHTYTTHPDRPARDFYEAPHLKGTKLYPSQEVLKYLFDYKDGNLINKIKRGSSCIPGNIAGNVGAWGYYQLNINRRKYRLHRIIFLWHNGYLPTEIDHIDGDKSNNRIENLRAATRSQNQCNMPSRKNSSSKYLGVNLKINRWRATVSDKHIGYFDTESQAALAYNREAVKLFGEFANLNIIK